MRKTRVLLVEDNRILRDGIKAIIDEQADLRVVASGGGMYDTLREAKKSNPGVVLIDLAPRNKSGVEVLISLKRELPDVRVIGMGLIPSQADIVEFVKAGASGFIIKDASIDDVLNTIRIVARGEKVIPPILTGSLFSHVVEHALRKRNGDVRGAARMTKREKEIVILIADGLSNKDISQRLHIEIDTVKSHVHNILEKLALNSRLQVSAYFHNEGSF